MSNPLAKYFRQPQLYVKLPSMGKWYRPESIDMPVTKELPVFPMTAKDEIMIKTPDALLTGQATVDVIHSCVPNIKNAWDIPAVDLDMILIAIRRATYGNVMEFVSVCPHCKKQNENAINLEVLSNSEFIPDFDEVIQVQGLEIYVKPQNYYQINKIAMENFEQQRAAMFLLDENTSQEQKKIMINDFIAKIVEISLEVVKTSILAIKTQEGVLVQEQAFIEEFLRNCNKEVWESIRKRLESIGDQSPSKKIQLDCIQDNCKKSYTTPLIFDLANFFA
jgi:hypothetical protein